MDLADLPVSSFLALSTKVSLSLLFLSEKMLRLLDDLLELLKEPMA